MSSNLDWDDRAKNLIKNLLKAQEEGRVSSSCLYKHHVHTPFELCEEILEQIDHDLCSDSGGKYLVMFNLEFLYKLKKFIDFGEDRVYYYTTDTNKAKAALRLFPEVVILDELEDGMKFDVIVGNPPYQDSTAKSSKKLWPQFIENSFKLLNKDGYLCMITPSSWMGGASSVFQLMKTNQCEHLFTSIAHHFPGIGSTFSAYVIRNSVRSSLTTTDIGVDIDFGGIDALPRDINRNSMSIIQKFVAETHLDVKFDSFCHTQRTDRVSATQTTEFRFPNKHGSSTIVWSNEEHPAARKQKVMFYMSGNPKPSYDNGVYGITQHQGYVETSSAAEGNQLIHYLSSKLVKFFILSMSHAQAWNKNILSDIPMIDLSRTWTDKELYDHFGLTEEERIHIDPSYKS